MNSRRNQLLFHPGLQSPCGLVHFSSHAVTGAVRSIKFFISEAFLGQHFEAVELEGSEPEPGDLFLFRLMSPTGRWCGAHVGVYCGLGEIIHFEGEKTGLGLGTEAAHQARSTSGWVSQGRRLPPPSSWCTSPKEVTWAPRAWGSGPRSPERWGCGWELGAGVTGPNPALIALDP